MPRPSNSRNRRDRDSDSMEALKPLLVLGLFGTILYGAYSVVQKGPGGSEPPAALSTAGDAAAFAPPDVALPPPGDAPTTAALPAPPATAASLAAAPPTAAPPITPVESAPTNPSAVPPPAQQPTYLAAESAPPPVAEPVAATPPDPTARPDRLASLPVPQLPATMPDAASAAAAIVPPATASTSPSSAAFASAWTDAHDKLAAGRYAEALSSLSVWYDDPSLGLEESQRLEDLLGQLAGTVIYSQEDLLLPPHVVAAGETLPTIATPLGVSWQLLAKINGVDDPTRLIPGERLKLVRGPFDAVVSVSRRRISLQLKGNYAGSFPVVVGRQYLERVGGSIPVVSVNSVDPNALPGGPAASKPVIALGEGMTIEAVDDPGVVADAAPSSSLVVAPRDLAELIDILGPGSRILVRQ